MVDQHASYVSSVYAARHAVQKSETTLHVFIVTSSQNKRKVVYSSTVAADPEMNPRLAKRLASYVS